MAKLYQLRPAVSQGRVRSILHYYLAATQFLRTAHPRSAAFRAQHSSPSISRASFRDADGQLSPPIPIRIVVLSSDPLLCRAAKLRDCAAKKPREAVLRQRALFTGFRQSRASYFVRVGDQKWPQNVNKFSM